MLKAVVLIGLVAFVTAQKASFENFQVYRIIPETNEQLDTLREIENYKASYEFWRGPSYVHHPVDIMVSPSQVAELIDFFNANQLRYETYVNNVQKLIDNENLESKVVRATADEYDFKSYKTLDQIYAFLDSVAKKYPSNVEVIIVGKSYEGRDIKGVKISHGKNKPAVFIESGIHAREWITCATATYIIDALLTSKDANVTALAEAYDFYIVPSVNPDGYVYSHKHNRLWRKTRSPGNKFCVGTDANRNWDYQWMTVGASSRPCDETYAGKAPFSEDETRTLSKYIESVKDKLFAYISFHSYSQLLLFPYGHTTAHLENYDELHAIAGKAVAALAQRYGTRYTYGNIAETIYKASGSSIDYVKAKLKIDLSYTYEFRDQGNYGFLLPASQIIPNGEEILDSLIAMFKEAKKIGYPKPQ